MNLDEAEVLRLYTEEQMSCLGIGRHFGASRNTIRRIVIAAGAMRAPGRTRPGSTDESRREASRLFHVEGIKNRAEIARRLGLRYMAVHRAVDLRLHLVKKRVG